MSGAISLRRKRDGFLVALTPGHHRPGHSCDLVGKRDGGDLRRSPRQQCPEPRPVFGAMDLGMADDGERTGHEQAAQIAIALLANTVLWKLGYQLLKFGLRPSSGGAGTYVPQRAGGECEFGDVIPAGRIHDN
jgi:hypothetical protein